VREYFRRKRFRNFLREYRSCPSILDVGGDHQMWHGIGRSNGITILNVNVPRRTEEFQYVRGSGCEMPFRDKSFDLAFSNSAIEHVGSEEMIRVGKRIYCQTPSRLFLIDPHLTTPFLHWLPSTWLTLGLSTAYPETIPRSGKRRNQRTSRSSLRIRPSTKSSTAL
jgi:hypothetical protein